MPIFSDHELLFVHIPKNAGRSIELALLDGEGSPESGRRSLVNRIATLFARSTASTFPTKHLIGTLDVALSAQHLTYAEMDLLGLIPAEERLTSFAVVRNPYDRALSSAMHFFGGDWTQESDLKTLRLNFEKALNDWLDRELKDHNDRAHRRPQIDYLRDLTGEIVVDKVLRFESLAEDFSAFMAEHSGKSLALSRRGHSGRGRTYHDFYNSASRRRVEDAFGDDIDAFNYAF